VSGGNGLGGRSTTATRRLLQTLLETLPPTVAELELSEMRFTSFDELDTLVCAAALGDDATLRLIDVTIDPVAAAAALVLPPLPAIAFPPVVVAPTSPPTADAERDLIDVSNDASPGVRSPEKSASNEPMDADGYGSLVIDRAPKPKPKAPTRLASFRSLVTRDTTSSLVIGFVRKHAASLQSLEVRVSALANDRELYWTAEMYVDSVGACHSLESLVFPTRVGHCMRLPDAVRLVEVAVPGDIVCADTCAPPDLQTLRLGVLRASSDQSLPKSWAATSITTLEVGRLEPPDISGCARYISALAPKLRTLTVPYTAVAIALVGELAATLSSLRFVRFATSLPATAPASKAALRADTRDKLLDHTAAMTSAATELRASLRCELVASRPHIVCEFPPETVGVGARVSKAA
jgi:hypothetical protein